MSWMRGRGRAGAEALSGARRRPPPRSQRPSRSGARAVHGVVRPGPCTFPCLRDDTFSAVRVGWRARRLGRPSVGVVGNGRHAEAALRTDERGMGQAGPSAPFIPVPCGAAEAKGGGLGWGAALGRNAFEFPLKGTPRIPLYSRSRVLGDVCLGTCAWGRVLGDVCLGTCAWGHVMWPRASRPCA